MLYSSSRHKHQPRNANATAAMLISVPSGFFIVPFASKGKIRYACISMAIVHDATPIGVAM